MSRRSIATLPLRTVIARGLLGGVGVWCVLAAVMLMGR